MTPALNPDIYTFFKELAANNTREWFEPNKVRFKALEAEVKQFSADLVNIMNEHDTIDKFKLFRLYRDVRFRRIKPHLKHILVFLFTVKSLHCGRILSPHQTWGQFYCYRLLDAK